MNKTKSLQTTKRLIAFDFDHTIVNKNTDIVVRDLIDSSKIPESTRELYKSNGWIPYMQEIFKILYKNNIKRNEIEKAVLTIPEVPGMINCIKTLHDHKNFDIIIISDSNSEFINLWNTKYNITKYFNEIYTNPAKFNSDNLLLLEPYHTQIDCSISSINLCKGKVLDNYIKEKKIESQINYDCVIFVGDGYHDICPMLRLQKCDIACPRLTYAADRDLIKTAEKISAEIKASVIKWTDGNDLLDEILKKL